MREKRAIQIKKSSEVKLHLSDRQHQFIREMFDQLGQMFVYLKEIGISSEPTIFLHALFEREGVDSSRIEGTKTEYEEMFYNLNKRIDNVFDWELFNLINLYKNLKNKVDSSLFKLNIDSLCNLHIELFKQNDDFYFDQTKVIAQKRPGEILSDDDKPNWIQMKDYNLQLVKPSEKTAWLIDLFENINNKENDPIKELIKFHPIFEAIHPFSDGNGRIGRLILTFLYKTITGKNHYFLLSDIWYDKKEEYLKELNNVQTTNDWDSWTFYLIGILLKSIKKRKGQVRDIINLYKKYHFISKDRVGKWIMNIIFKQPIINRARIIKIMINELKIPQTTAYRKIEAFFQSTNGTFENGYYRFEELLNIVKR